MALNAITTQRLVAVAQAAAAAGPGGKGAIYAAACIELGISLATLHRYLAKVTMKPERKQRSDAGSVSLTRDEATAISALLITSQRKNNKRLLSIGQAVEILRANNEIRAEFLDEPTGELRPLSDSAIARALRVHGMHPDQLNRPTPAVELKSLHPNHVWQIDASLCVLYYLNAETERETGLQVMERERFYKNKPRNLKAIEQDRVWSYEGTDHNSGGLMLNYVLGAESGTNLAESFIEFIQQRQVIHGVPFILMMDMGSANTSGLFKNLARRLQVKIIPHMPGNARATGQVENARNIIERSFEPALRLMPVANLAELNAQAHRWADWYNAQKVHSRHGRTRAEQWMTIAAEQLRLAPPPEFCRELLTHEPESRKVSDTLTVQFKGREFNVRGVPGAMVGEKVMVTFSPYATDTATIIDTDADGNELLHSIPVVHRDDAGFRVDANVIGEDYRRPADTQLDTNRKEVERFAWDAATDAEVEAKKKAKAVPFGGRIDPYAPIEQAPERTFLPRRGTELRPAVVTQAAPARVLSLFEAARHLTDKGLALNAERHAQIRAWYPDGVPEDQLDALADRLQVRAQLRVVAGGGGA
ncbi:integrase [Roseateles sp. DAIF2]|uniref:integrase n=1 Tax=Roseateles sp. DAIF2 TaxID=2714952 RepID=UPI001BC9A431|nr:integrase [Roseateles sp. DAIF2]